MNKNIKNILAASVLSASAAYAGVPLNNLQGVGGIAFNPLAYTAGQPWDGGETNVFNGIVSKPQVGGWYVNLSDSDINWFAIGTALTFAERLEVSYGYGFTDADKYGDKSIDSNNLGAKLRILDENAFETQWVPAIAVGAVYKHTNTDLASAFGLDKDGFDYYAVASKLVKETPIPVLLSLGILYSDEVVNGVIGHGHYDVSYFANIDVLPSDNIAVGFEYKSGVDAETSGIRNHDYYDGHVAWFVTPQLTLVGAYAYTGDKDRFYRDGNPKNLGFGGGLVLSVQYQF